ncbi:MAG TPA: HAMP domain-containing sensor histidine kinase [Gammaproteobacteria bacterium]
MMRRLYLQIYVSFVAILLIFVLLLAIGFQMLPDSAWERRLDNIGEIVSELLVPPDQTPEETQAAIERVSEVLIAEITMREADGTLIAFTGEPIEMPRGRRVRDGRATFEEDSSAVLELPDGRLFLVDPEERGPPALFLTLALLAVAIAIGSLPIARRITRRLERLQKRVEDLGAGHLSTRVEIEGKDEVAELARSFNRSADRIERLVEAQRHVLAGVSHEIRTPLARMRVALELLESEDRPELRKRLLRDISELDELIGELLLASRLDSIDQFDRTEDVDILALLAEEAARTGADVSGTPVTIHGDPRMLRRLLRNLLENADKYAGESAVETEVRPGPEGEAILTVADRGPGIPEDERERIFEPFYRSGNARRENDRSVGLGLSLVRRIADRHGGTVRCLSRDGGGTSFEVVLPPST